MLIKNIEKKMKLAQFTVIGALLTAIILVGLVCFFATNLINKAAQTSYTLIDGIPYQTTKSTDNDRIIENKALIESFHQLFFSIIPDEKFIENNMNKAMYLVDQSGMLQYNNLKEKGYFSSILSSSAIITLQTDSVILKENSFSYYGKQKIDRKSNIVIRRLITTGEIKKLEHRSEKNPFGKIIFNWKTLDNTDLTNEQKSQF